MKRLAALALMLVLSATLVSAQTQEEKLEETPYLPLKIGTTWTYQTPLDGQNKTLVNKVVAHEKIDKVMCAKVETFVNGKSVAYEHIGVTKDGIYRYSLNGTKADKPILLLKLPPKKGDEWQIDAKFGNETITGTLKTAEEKITVPAGTYETFVAAGKLEAGGQTIGVANYFAKGVGIVRIKNEALGQPPITIDLEKFEPAK